MGNRLDLTLGGKLNVRYSRLLRSPNIHKSVPNFYVESLMWPLYCIPLRKVWDMCEVVLSKNENEIYNFSGISVLILIWMFFMTSGIQWYQFCENHMHIQSFVTGKTNFGWFYQNEAWESVRIFCVFMWFSSEIARNFFFRMSYSIQNMP